MSTIGHTINGGLVFVICVAMVGTAGATFYFQHSVDQMDERAEALSDRTETLERNLTATRAALRAERARVRELNESLVASKSDVSTLSTRLKRADDRQDATETELVRRERRLGSTESELAEVEANLHAVCDRLETLSESDATAAATADPWEDQLQQEERWDYELHENRSWEGASDDDYGDVEADLPAACAR